MTSVATADTDDARCVLLSGNVRLTPERVWALAWSRLLDQIAPKTATIAHRVTVLAPIRLRSD